MDFVAAWKAISIALTGAFGILGLATEFKNKHTKKITKWGWVSLVGIIVSSVCGVAAQLKESHDDAAKSLDLAQKSSQTLNNIQKLLAPTIENPRVEAIFTVLCKNQARKCKYIWSHQESRGRWYIELRFFYEPKDADSYLSGEDVEPDRTYSNKLDCTGFRADSTNARSDMSLVCYPSTLESEPLASNNGKIRDIIDLEKAKCVMEIDELGTDAFLDNGGGAQVADPRIEMTVKNGITYKMKPPIVERKARDGIFYVGSFGEPKSTPQSTESSAAPSPAAPTPEAK
jgi:hypothetical protein